MSFHTSRAQIAGRRSHVFAMAAADPQAQLAEHAALVRALVGDVTDIKAEIDKINVLVGSLKAGPGPGGDNARAAKPDPMMQAFAVFARTGSGHPRHFNEFIASAEGQEVAQRFGVQAAATTQSNPDGGYTVLPQIEQTIRDVARDYSPMRRLAKVQPITKGSYQIIVDPSLMEAQWVGETSARPETAGKKVQAITIPAEEIYANPHASQTLIDDSFVDIGLWFETAAANAFAITEGKAFASGDGKLKPRGFLTYPTDTADDFVREWGKLQYIAAGSATPSSAQLADALIALSMKLRVPYRPNAVWQMNRDTARVVRQLKDQNGLLLWSNDGRFVEGVQNLLLGFPVDLNEDMPGIGANAFPIALGDWRGYTIVDRRGVNVLRDPFTNKPLVGFYTTKRVGGAVVDYNSIKLLKIAAS
jgi:HK97 family phage major capsid protein